MDISWAEFSKDMVAIAKQKGIPVAGHFELTPRCNLQCKMCYVCKPASDQNTIEKELTAEEWIRVAREAREAGMLYLLLTGGEVFIRKDFRMIYEEISRMGFIITIFTNATMITPEIADWLMANPPSSIGVTLYGASPKTYKHLCGNESGYERAFRGVDLLLSRGMHVELRTTIVRNNVSDFDQLYRFAEDRKIKLRVCNYVFLRRDETSPSPGVERLSAIEMAEHEVYMDEKYYSSGQEASPDHKNTSGNTPQQNSYMQTDNENPFFTCSGGKCSFWVTWDGRMLYCGEVDTPHTYPLREGFMTAWERLREHCSSIPACKQCMMCQYKEYCMACPARLKNETGYYDRPSSYLCELAKHRAWLKRQIRNGPQNIVEGSEVNEAL